MQRNQQKDDKPYFIVENRDNGNDEMLKCCKAITEVFKWFNFKVTPRATPRMTSAYMAHLSAKWDEISSKTINLPSKSKIETCQ